MSIQHSPSHLTKPVIGFHANTNDVSPVAPAIFQTLPSLIRFVRKNPSACLSDWNPILVPLPPLLLLFGSSFAACHVVLRCFVLFVSWPAARTCCATWIWHFCSSFAVTDDAELRTSRPDRSCDIHVLRKKKEHTHVTHTHVTHTHPPVTDARTPTHALLDMQVWVTLSWARLVTQHRQLILTTPPGPPHALRCKQLGGVSGRSVRELIVAVTEWCAPLPQTDRKDPQGTTLVTGFEVLLQKQLKGKQLQKEMAEFIHER